MVLTLAAAVPTVAVKGPHQLSPTGVAVVIIIAFLIDYLSVLAAAVQTRLVFMCVCVAVREGFNNSPLDKWTVDKASGIIQSLLDQAKGAYIAGASAQTLVGCAVGALWVYALGCMLPVKWSKKFGRLSTAQFKETGFRKMNWQIWAIAVPCGMLADMPVGWIGDLCRGAMTFFAMVVDLLPGLIFGVS